MDFELMAETLPRLLSGVPVTLTLVVSSLILGFVFAVILAQMRLSNNLLMSNVAYCYVYVFRSTPLLVQIFLIYYGSGQFREFLESVGLWYFLREPYFCAILALTMNTAAYTAEIIRGGILSVPWGQLEAGRAVGMSGVTLFRRIVFPVAIRQALPAYGNEIILMVKSTSLASTITILEVTGIAKKIIAATFAPMEVFIIAGAIYLSMNFIVTRGIQWIEIKLSPQLYRDRSAVAKPKADEVLAH
ncbi:MAG: ABC transporter permease subunit [Gammaproteobacteria bacterium]|jgi:octopine/nopaline transport system permease protein|nr:ABC transporter permease subunit [Gammaproteobacteria bacterium]